MDSPLRQEFEHYLRRQAEMVEKHDGKVVAIKDCEVIGVFDGYMDADIECSKRHEPGTYLLQKVSAGDRDYTARIYSRVVFP